MQLLRVETVILKQRLQPINMLLDLCSFEYIDDSISTVDINGVEATAENVLQQTYSLSRPFLFVYKEEHLSTEGQQFIEYILSPKGQNICIRGGSHPIKMSVMMY